MSHKRNVERLQKWMRTATEKAKERQRKRLDNVNNPKKNKTEK